jgi:RNA polymerase sigma factor (TIGR02999 family)
MVSITELLMQSSAGESDALRELYARLYPEIKRVAHGRLSQAGGVVGLNTTALVHEGFLRIAEQQGLQGASRGQFFAYVGQVLRSVVIDFLRSQGRDKRGGDVAMVTMSAADLEPSPASDVADLIGIDRALVAMRELDRDLYELVEMHMFAGVTILEVAELRGVSSRTVNRDIIKARALLSELLGNLDP